MSEWFKDPPSYGRNCKICSKPLQKRQREYCSPKCRKEFADKKTAMFSDKVTGNIKKNDNVLRNFVNKKKSIITKQELEAEGFCFQYCTHYKESTFFRTKKFYFEYGIEFLSKESFRIIKTDINLDF